MPEVTRYEGGKLTLDGWKAIHAEGHSVLHNGTVYPPGSKIPDVADITAGNPVREQAARDALTTQMLELQHQIAMIGKSSEMVEPVTGATSLLTESPVGTPDLAGAAPPTSGPDAPTPDKRAKKGETPLDPTQPPTDEGK